MIHPDNFEYSSTQSPSPLPTVHLEQGIISDDEAIHLQHTSGRQQRQKQIHVHWKTNTKTIPYMLQSDTGANISATNDISIRHSYQSLDQPIQIQTYNQEEQGNSDTTQTINIITDRYNAGGYDLSPCDSTPQRQPKTRIGQFQTPLLRGSRS